MPGHYTLSLGGDPDYMNRVLRLYMPRTYQHMRETADMIVLREASCGSYDFPQVFFDARWMVWFVKAVQEDGVPLSMWGGDASWGGLGDGNYKSWGDTVLDQVLPFNSLGGYNPPRPAFNKPRFLDPTNGLTRLPWGSAGHVELLNKVTPKPGAILLAEAVGASATYPWIAWWESGKGRVLGETQVFGSAGGGTATLYMCNEWDWYQDFLIYLVYFGAGKPIPDSPERAHRLREEINIHREKRGLLISLLEFIEKFGASTVRLQEELEDMEQLERMAEDSYLRDDYDTASDLFDDLQRTWVALNAKAIKAKENALLWVYVIEWFTVTAAGMIAGSFLWLVMVRRRLYREIATTRMGRGG